MALLTRGLAALCERVQTEDWPRSQLISDWSFLSCSFPDVVHRPRAWIRDPTYPFEHPLLDKAVGQRVRSRACVEPWRDTIALWMCPPARTRVLFARRECHNYVHQVPRAREEEHFEGKLILANAVEVTMEV